MTEPIQIALTRTFSVDTIIYMQHVQARVTTNDKNLLRSWEYETRGGGKWNSIHKSNVQSKKLSTQLGGNTEEIFGRCFWTSTRQGGR